jgi:effector-binding domain-containing protein
VDHQIELVEKYFGPCLEIEERRSAFTMGSVFAKDFPEISKTLENQGIKNHGSPYARYMDVDWQVEANRNALVGLFMALFKKWHFHAGIPAHAAVKGEGRIKVFEPGNRRYVTGIYHGSYANLMVLYRELVSWAKANDVQLTKESYEVYTNDPTKVKPEEVETRVFIPIAESF